MFASFINSSSFWTNYADNWIWFGGGVIAVGGFIWNQHRKALAKVVKKEVNSEIDKDFIEKLAREVEQIHHETQHNGGSSMKDALKRLEESTEKGFRKIEEQQEQLERYIQKLDKALERHFGYHEGIDD